ncbi:hypothetical protein IP88_03115 [alpha proteobacterium AAP81b]|nr:hypothetical protein IP88_03115 [alpha proteobacterium AAP81b]
MSGFTLIEMLVVLGITALIAGIAFPAVERLQGVASFAAAGRLTELALRQAHADAIAQGRAVRFATVADGSALFITNRPEMPLPVPARAEAPAAGILFFADGSASGGAIRLTAGPRARGFRVDPDSGAILADAPAAGGAPR